LLWLQLMLLPLLLLLLLPSELVGSSAITLLPLPLICLLSALLIKLSTKLIR